MRSLEHWCDEREAGYRTKLGCMSYECTEDVRSTYRAEDASRNPLPDQSADSGLRRGRRVRRSADANERRSRPIIGAEIESEGGRPIWGSRALFRSSFQRPIASLTQASSSRWATMMSIRPSKSALRSIHIQRQLTSGRRPFSTSVAAAAPHRSSPQKRAQSTATAAS